MRGEEGAELLVVGCWFKMCRIRPIRLICRISL